MSEVLPLYGAGPRSYLRPVRGTGIRRAALDRVVPGVRRLPGVAHNQKARAAFAAFIMLAGATACSDTSGKAEPGAGKDKDKDKASIRVEHGDALADGPTGIEVTGLEPGQRVTIAAHARDQRKLPWASQGDFTADPEGVVDLAEAAPRGGKPYERADSMGLLSTLLPVDDKASKVVGSGKSFSYHPAAPALDRSYKVRLTVSETAGGGAGKGERNAEQAVEAETGDAGKEARAGGTKAGEEIADRTITRRWLADGVRHERLTVEKDKVDGELYTPPKGSAKRAPVLVFGGSEGGNSGEYTAALLASRGHPAMSLCYFDCGEGSGRPGAIEKIDLGYFTRAAAILGKEPAADPGKLAVMGNSRGSEVAQLLGQRHPGLVRDVIAYAPSAKINGPYSPSRPAKGPSAWAEHGKPIPAGPISLDKVRGKVLAVAGGNDKMWGSAASAELIAKQRGASGKKHEQMTYDGAGHHVNWFPYGQPGQEGGADGNVMGTSSADQNARADSWPRVLKLLDR